MTKTDRRAKRRSKTIEKKKFQQVPAEVEKQATIRLTKKERSQKLAERVLGEIKEQYDPMRLDASVVTNYVGRNGGIIQGASLKELYDMLSIEALHDTSSIGSWRAEVAVAYACSSKWLVRQEAADDSEWIYSIPNVEQDDSLPNLALVA